MIFSIEILYSVLIVCAFISGALWYTATRKPVEKRDADENFMYIIGVFFCIVFMGLIVLVTFYQIFQPSTPT